MTVASQILSGRGDPPSRSIDREAPGPPSAPRRAVFTKGPARNFLLEDEPQALGELIARVALVTDADTTTGRPRCVVAGAR